MIYVTFNPRDCPDMPFFRYVWYWYRYFSKVYKFTKYNLINLRFGRFMEFLHNIKIKLRSRELNILNVRFYIAVN